MDLEVGDTVERGLRHYVDRVARALGLATHGTYVSHGPPLNAYLALDGRLATQPDRDPALLWDERQGWSVAVEAPGGTELLVLGHLGTEVLPAPVVVADLTRRVLAGEGVGTSTAPSVRPGDDLLARLADYADGSAPLRL